MNMNLNEMQNAWNSPRNNLPTAEQQRLAQQFTRQVIRRRRFQAIWLTNTFVWLTLITLVVVQTIAAGKFQAHARMGRDPIIDRAVGICHPLSATVSETSCARCIGRSASD